MPELPHIETSQLICIANQLTGFYMRATLAFNGLKTLRAKEKFTCDLVHNILEFYKFNY